MKVDKRYSGPSGVYYDIKHDDIFTLQWTGAYIFNIKTKKIDGKSYDYQDGSRKLKRTAIVLDPKDVVLLEEYD